MIFALGFFETSTHEGVFFGLIAAKIQFLLMFVVIFGLEKRSAWNSTVFACCCFSTEIFSFSMACTFPVLHIHSVYLVRLLCVRVYVLVAEFENWNMRIERQAAMQFLFAMIHIVYSTNINKTKKTKLFSWFFAFGRGNEAESITMCHLALSLFWSFFTHKQQNAWKCIFRVFETHGLG